MLYHLYSPNCFELLLKVATAVVHSPVLMKLLRCRYRNCLVDFYMNIPFFYRLVKFLINYDWKLEEWRRNPSDLPSDLFHYAKGELPSNEESVTDYLDELIFLCLQENTDGIEKDLIDSDKTIEIKKLTFNYPCALVASLYLVTKYFR